MTMRINKVQASLIPEEPRDFCSAGCVVLASCWGEGGEYAMELKMAAGKVRQTSTSNKEDMFTVQ